MKKLLLFSIALIGFSICFTCFVNAQGVGINSTGNPPDPSASLDVSGASKGVLINRMTTAERDSIANPAIGLLIFNTTTNCFNVWLGNTWKKICGDCDFSNPVPGNNGPLCEGGTLLLTSTSVGNGATYQWSGPNGFVSTEQNPSITNATAVTSGSYALVATLNGCVSASQSTVVTVNAIPQTPVAGNNGPLLCGDILNLTSSTINGANYSWTGPNNFTANTQNPTISNIQSSVNAGIYNVIASVTGCNSAAGTTTVVINGPSTPGTISGATTVARSSTGNIYSISTVIGATSYNWTVPSGASITAGSGTTSITVTFGGPGSGNITVSAVNACGASSPSSLPITINPIAISFTSVGTTTWTPPSGVTSVQVLVVAGGGGGGRYGGGGGGGGVLYNGSYPVTNQLYTVTVGDGGAGWVGDTQSGGNAGNGGNSVFATLTAIGGGGAGCYGNPNGSPGNSGGSGGGGGNTNGGPATSGGSGTAGQGNSGGGAPAGDYGTYGGGGGGGAGTQGANGNTNGKGGDGLIYSISGVSTYYGGGGSGGQTSASTLAGGLGGGGTGFAAGVSGTTAIDGAANTGGGGGGGRDNYINGNWRAGNGGSGIVIIAY